MSPLRQQMIAALHLSGKGERTQQAYIREVRLLAQCYHKSPDRISAQELQHYFLHRQNVDGLAPASMRLCSSGLRFFSQHVLKRDWSTLALMRAQTAPRLPAVRSAVLAWSPLAMGVLCGKYRQPQQQGEPRRWGETGVSGLQDMFLNDRSLRIAD
jgi:Phage integrase, N-terminal SAM-like domain